MKLSFVGSFGLVIAVACAPVAAQNTASCTFHTIPITVSGGVALAQGMNASGTIVGYVNEFNSHSEGFIRYTTGGVSTYMVPNSANTTIMRRSDAGVNVGYFTPNGSTGQKGFIATGNKFQSVAYPGAALTYLNDVNKYGTLVGQYLGTDGHFHGFRLSNGSFSSIHPPGATDTFVTGINDSGTIVGSYNAGGDSHGFIYKGGTYQTITFPGESGFGGTSLSDIANSGEIVGSIWTGSDSQEAFLYKSGAFEVVSVPHARLTQANGISNKNMIVGHAVVVSSSGSESDTTFTATCN